MKLNVLELLFFAFVVLLFALLSIGIADSNMPCRDSAKYGAEVVWVDHRLFEDPCYIPVNISGTLVKMSPLDWLRYFGENKD